MLQPSPGNATTVRTRLLDALPAVATVVVIVTGLLVVNTPVTAIVRYSAYLFFAVQLPGTLVHRALRGRHPLLVADLALGGATGLLLGLVAWAGFMVLGVQEYLWVWPLAVIVPFLAVPSLRRHWRPGGHTERSRVTSWLLAAVLCLYTLHLVSTAMWVYDLPPRANEYYIDVYWHLANAAELTRQLPPEVPSVAGRTLRYHWFANAHMGASHLMSGVDLPTIMLRLWEIPIVAVILGLVLAVTRKATGAIWPGAVAAFIIVAPAQLLPWSWFRPWVSYALTEGSPSQVFGLVPLLLAATVLIGVVRGERIGRGGWLVLALAVAAAPGSKPAALPILMGGLGAVLLLNLVRRRPVRPILVVIAMMVVSTIALGPLVAQAVSASAVKLLGLLYFMPAWTLYNDKEEYPTLGGFLIEGFTDHPFYASLLMAAVLMQFAIVLAALPLLRRRHRWDPAVVLLGAGFLCSIAAALVVDHAGGSEIYFANTGLPFAAILAAWALYIVLPRGATWSARRRMLIVGVAGTAIGGAILLAVLIVARGPKPAIPDYPREVGTPLGVLVLSAAIAVAAWWVLRSVVQPALRGFGMAVFCVALTALLTLQAPISKFDHSWNAATKTRPTKHSWHVTAQETLAARWVAKKVPRDDIIATNVHCKLKKTVPRCDGRAYWVAGLTERRILVESWAYTEETLRQIGLYKGIFPTYPFDDPALYQLNEQAFRNPTAEGLATLRDKYHVRWLFADRLAGPVSPKLKRLAKLQLDNKDVQVFELR